MGYDGPKDSFTVLSSDLGVLSRGNGKQFSVCLCTLGGEKTKEANMTENTTVEIFSDYI